MPKDNSHLSLEERKIIEKGIEEGATKTAIAKTIGKDNSTVGKEIKAHRHLEHKCALPLECAAYRHCKLGRTCTIACPEYMPFECKRRDRSPGACNGCSNYGYCRFDKFYYHANQAENEYRTQLVETRIGFDLDRETVEQIC